MLIRIDNDMWIGYIKDDPVRPHISPYFRITENRTTFALMDDDEYAPRAIICVAFTSDVFTTEKDLTEYGNNVAMFYTVWSYDRGAGREIIQQVVEWIKENSPEVTRFVTLSPKTEMARRFHTRNGAFQLQENKDSINYEYEV